MTRWRAAGLWWWAPLVLGGCVGWTPPLAPEQPLFQPDSGESKAYQALARKQEQLAAKCAETGTCDHVYFTRALAGLFESREVAEKYFAKVIALSPKSRLGQSSQAWLRLLQAPAAPGDPSWAQAVASAPALAEAHAALLHAAGRSVRDVLNQEIVTQQLRVSRESDAQTVESLQRELAELERRIEQLTAKKDPPRVAEQTVHALQKQVQERDRKIEELAGQLEALKRIDQEMREKVRPSRPSGGGLGGAVQDNSQ